MVATTASSPHYYCMPPSLDELDNLIKPITKISSEPFFFPASNPANLRLITSLVDLHVACIERDDALMRFHPPFNEAKREKMLGFWKARVKQMERGERITFITTASPVTGLGEDVMITGVVELALPDAETGPFRGEVEMLMVHPDFRKERLGRKLMVALEREAVRRGRLLLQLSTTKDSVADLYAYPKMGYTKFGIVPNYGIQPSDGRLVDGVYMYKDLRKVKPLEP